MNAPPLHTRPPLAIGVLCLAWVFWLIAVPALAQGQSSTEDPGDSSEIPERDVPSQVDEITVTGERSQVTDIQSESEAITAFDMEALDRANISGVDALAFNVPALHIGQQGADSIVTLRGVSTENASPTGEAGVQFHVDGVNYARPAAARVAFFDLEGLQVLRGPQGVRGGKNSTAGWINVVTRKPTSEFAVEGDFQWGSYNERRVRAAVNLPINEYAQTRFATYIISRDGYQRNLLFRDEDRDAVDADDFGFRSHLRLLPRDDLEVILSYNYYQAKGVGPLEEVIGLEPERRCNPIPPPLGTGYNPNTYFPSYAGCGANPNRTTPQGFPAPIYASTGFDLDGNPRFRNFENPITRNRGESRAVATRAAITPHQLYTDRPTSQDNKFWGFTGNVAWDVPELPFFGSTELRWIPSFQNTHPDRTRDSDGTDLPLFFGTEDTESEQWSHELQWKGTGLDERLDWQGSLFWAQEETVLDTDFTIRLGNTLPIFIDQETKNTSFGAAFHTEWHLREDLSLELGGRYIRDEKRSTMLRSNPERTGQNLGASLLFCDGPAVDLLPPFKEPDEQTPWCQLTFREMTGEATLNYWPAEDNLLYFSIANGFKAGGFAVGEAIAREEDLAPRQDFDPDLGRYDPENIWAFTLGSKNTFFDERLTLNIEAYFYNYRNQQLVLVDGLSTRTDNADSEMTGVDLEYNAEPLPGLRLDGFVSWMDTEFTEYLAVDPVDVLTSSACRIESQNPNAGSLPPGCVPTDYSGNELSRSPTLTYSIGAEYDLYLGRYGTLTPRIQFYWQDDTWFRPYNRTAANSGRNSPCPVPGLNAGGCRLVDVGTPNERSVLLNAADARDLQESYHFTDLKLTWRSPSETYTAEAFLQNLEDEVVYQNVLVGTPALDAPQMAWYGHPRIYGFRVGMRF